MGKRLFPHSILRPDIPGPAGFFALAGCRLGHNVFQNMNRRLNLLAGVLALGLASGCETTKTGSAPPENPFATYLEDTLRPVILLGAQTGAYWIREKKWPVSIDDLAALREIDASWKSQPANFSEVTFERQANGSLTITGKMSLPKFAGRTVTSQKPAEFTIRVTMRPAPETTAGWAPHIETDFAGKKFEGPS